MLSDRQTEIERVQQLAHLRQRLAQAFRYFDGLTRPAALPAAPREAPACPVCRKPYSRATGVSPQGIVYEHANGTECRV